MNSLAVEPILQKVICNVFEDAVFIFAEESCDEPAWTGQLLVAVLPFQGPRPGRLEMTVSLEFGPVLANNLLGLDEESSEDEPFCSDAVGEILNMIGGIFIQEWPEDDKPTDISVPQVRIVAAEEYASRQESPVASSLLCTEEGEPVVVSLYLTGGSA